MSLKRHPALQDLSRDHHLFLLQARNIKWLVEGHERAEPLQAVVEALLQFWETHGEPHLREEETVLFPLYLHYAPHAQKSITRLERDHQWLREKVEELSAMPRYENCDPILRSLGQYIEGHVRQEEQVVFEAIQAAFDDATLQALAAQSLAFRQQHRTPDSIGPAKPTLLDDAELS